MEAFGMVDRKMIYAGMNKYCAVLADKLSPVDELETPHTFSEGFFEKILRCAVDSNQI